MLAEPNILCVEDDPADQEALRGYADILGWPMTFAMNCAEGYERANSRRYDVILTDQNMPDCSGLDLIRKIRSSDGPSKNTPVLLNSWGLSDSVRAIAQALAVNVVLPKPVLLSTFKTEIRKLAATSLLAR